MPFLRQQTAASIMLGAFVDATDAYTPETALTIAASDIRLSKCGSAFAAKSETTAASHQEFGWYKIIFNTTDTDSAGELVIAASVTGALPIQKTYDVINASAYDSLIPGSSQLQVDVRKWLGTAVVAPDTGGYPKVTIKSGTGTGEINLTSGGVALAASAITATALSTSAIVADVFSQAAANKVWLSASRDISSGSIVSNTDKQGYTLASSGIAAEGIAACAFDAAVITDAAASRLAEILLGLDMATITTEASRSPLNALRFLRNKWSLTGDTLTVCKEDDTAAAWTAVVTTSENASPIVATDPS